MGEKKLVEVSSLKVGSYVVIDDVCCVVKKIDISKPGKHGHAKSRIEAIGLIKGEKKIIVKPGHDHIGVPMIEKKSAQVLSIQGDTASVMDSENYETFDLIVPEELKGQVKEGSQVVYWVMLDDKVMKQVK